MAGLPMGARRSDGGRAFGNPFERLVALTKANQGPIKLYDYETKQSTVVLQKLQQGAFLNAAAKTAFVGEQAMADLLVKYSRKLRENPQLRKKVTEMHQKLALEARDEVVGAYTRSKIGKGKKSYRFADRGKLFRYSNKRLLNALKDDDLFQANATSIGLINVEMLDQQAVQWYRLNFGALPKGAKNSAKGMNSFLFFGKEVKGFNLNRYKPSKPFFVPQNRDVTAGYFGSNALPKHPSSVDPDVWRKQLGAPRGRYLYITPYREGIGEGSFLSVVSKGIRATRFLDAGVGLINDQYPKRLEAIIIEHEANARRIDIQRDIDRSF
jgi:hypothetical protein